MVKNLPDLKQDTDDDFDKSRLNNILESFEEEIEGLRFDLLVLRSHLYAEYYLEEALEDIFNTTDPFENFYFIQKLNIVEAAKYYKILNKGDRNIHDRVIENLKLLNNLRNTIGHEIDWGSDMNGIKGQIGQMNYLYEDRRPSNFKRKFRLKVLATMKGMKVATISNTQEKMKFDTTKNDRKGET